MESLHSGAAELGTIDQIAAHLNQPKPDQLLRMPRLPSSWYHRLD